LYLKALAAIALSLSILMAGAWIVRQRSGNSGWVDTIWDVARRPWRGYRIVDAALALVSRMLRRGIADNKKAGACRPSCTWFSQRSVFGARRLRPYWQRKPVCANVSFASRPAEGMSPIIKLIGVVVARMMRVHGRR
jgi:hypothetical protein